MTRSKEFIFSGARVIVSEMIHILHIHANKPIPVSANNILKPKDNSYFRDVVLFAWRVAKEYTWKFY